MAKPERPKSYGGLRVLIAGGGVAGLETLLALRALAGDLVDLEHPSPHSGTGRSRSPFDAGRADHFELARIAETTAAGFTLGRLASVDADANLTHRRGWRLVTLTGRCSALSASISSHVSSGADTWTSK